MAKINNSVRSANEAIKNAAITIKEFVDMDFSNTVDFDPEPKYYSRWKTPNYGGNDGILFEVELKDIIDERIPDWVYNESYTEEENALLDELYDDIFSDLITEYADEWDEKVQEYYDNKKMNAEEELGTEERYQEYLEAKAAFEARRDNYYGFCMHNGSKKDFRKMYGDGNFLSYGDWLLANYGE